MKVLATLLILIGFCMGTLGAAGFQSPWESATQVPPFALSQAMNGRIPGHPMDDSDAQFASQYAQLKLRRLHAEALATPEQQAAELLSFFGWENAEQAAQAKPLSPDAPVPQAWVQAALAGKVPGHPMDADAETKKRAVVRERLIALQEKVHFADSDDKEAAEVREALAVPLEEGAAWLFAGGLVLLLAGGYLARQEQKASGARDSQEGRKVLHGQIQAVRDDLARIRELATHSDGAEVRSQLTTLQEGQLYDLTSNFEHWTKVLGFDDYARIWAHVASGERLSNRAWTLYTDGYPTEGRAEIALAELAFEEAHNECIKENNRERAGFSG